MGSEKDSEVNAREIWNGWGSEGVKELTQRAVVLALHEEPLVPLV